MGSQFVFNRVIAEDLPALNNFENSDFKLISRGEFCLKWLERFHKLFNAYSKNLSDDFSEYSGGLDVFATLSLVEKISPWIWLITCGDEFCGFVFLERLMGEQITAKNYGNSTKKDFIPLDNLISIYSAEITACIERKFWGTATLYFAKKIIAHLRDDFGIKRLNAEIFSSNKLPVGVLKKIGFKKEGCKKLATLRNKKPVDVDFWGCDLNKFND